MKKESELRRNFRVFCWCIKLAWEMSKKALIGWIVICSLVALLPMLSLLWQKDIISTISEYLLTGSGTFADVTGAILILGGILVLIGLSNRINTEFIYLVIYDYYYIGLSERFMDLIQKIELKDLNRKEVQDEYRYVRYRFGELTSLMTNTFTAITQVVSIASMVLLALTYSTVIFGVTVIYLGVVLVINQKLTGKRTYSYVQDREFVRRTEYFENIVMQPGVAKELRIFKNADRMLREWEAAYEPIYSRDKKIAVWRNLISFFCSMGYYILIIVLLVYAVYQVKAGSMKVDVFLTLYGMTQSMSVVIQRFSNIFHHFKRNLYDMGRMKDFMETAPVAEDAEEAEGAATECPVVFEAKNLCFSYDDKREVLHHLNFQIRKGETIALVGLNGSGKSTLVKLLVELYQPTQGELLFEGKSYKKYKKGQINQNIGMFFQDFALFHASLRENVGYGDLKNIENREKIMEALRKGGGLKLVERMPEGMETWLLKKVKKGSVNLSGGEQQKVAVSRAHMSDKEVLIFDEPASALDPIAEMEQFAAIQEKIHGRTAVLISHRVGFARLADRIFVMDHGNLEEVGTHEELMEKDGIYAEFFRSQAEWYDVEKGEVAS